MTVAKTASCALAMILIVGCGSPKSATICQGDKRQIKVTIAAKTGANLACRLCKRCLRALE